MSDDALFRIFRDASDDHMRWLPGWKIVEIDGTLNMESVAEAIRAAERERIAKMAEEKAACEYEAGRVPYLDGQYVESAKHEGAARALHAFAARLRTTSPSEGPATTPPSEP